VEIAAHQHSGSRAVLDWLRLELGIKKTSHKLLALTALTADGLIDEVKKLRGRKAPVTVADMKRLKAKQVASFVLLQALEREADGYECQVSDLVNEAFGLTPDDVRSLWETAPPRMPLGPPARS
jgi:hypothetical protein